VIPGTWRTHKDGKGFRESKSSLVPTIPARARQDGRGQPVIKKGTKIRRLTPIECERLQGFPDGWTQFGMINEKKVDMSDTQRYKTLGNAVTAAVIEAIISKIKQTYK
jgi:DNA (cytosine-5)-methyltransferase 1